MSSADMRVTFILPGSAGDPVGGVRVAYEYANRLAAEGVRVTMVHSPVTRIDPPPLMLLKAAVRYPQRLIDRSYHPRRWMKVHRDVEVRWAPRLAERHIPPADVVVATAWKTAEWVGRYSVDKGRKFYLIQHWESWDADDARIEATWLLPLHKIVIARWLEAIAQRLGQTSSYIPNGLDFSEFGVDVPVADRRDPSVLMLYHDAAWKGSTDGIAALESARQRVPTLRANLFGVPRRPRSLPSWIGYHQLPPRRELRQLMNHASIFLAPSWAEGWPLPPAEAMMSGCALVGTDIGGHREYIVPGKTGLLSLPKQPESLADNLVELCRDDRLRREIAEAGHAFIQQFTWLKAFRAFKQTIAGQAQ